MIFQWRDGSRWRGNPQDMGERLEAIRTEAGGTLTPNAVVEDARAGDSPLHPNFEWDDAKAAESHRLATARSLIADVVVVYRDEIPDAPAEAMRAFSHLHNDASGAPAYTSTLEAMRDPTMRAHVLARAKAELDSWRRRYKQYAELSLAVQKVSEIAESIAA